MRGTGSLRSLPRHPSNNHLDEKARSFSFFTAMLINVIDQLGTNFLVPVMAPLGTFLGASDQQLGAFVTIRGLMLILSTIWLPKLADAKGQKLAVMLSMSGSAVAYTLQGLSTRFMDDELGSVFSNGGILMFTIGRAVAGLFGGTAPVLRAFVSDLYSYDVKVQKAKIVTLNVTNAALGLFLAPVAGSIAQVVLVGPYWVACAGAVFAFMWILCFFPTKGEEATDETRGANLEGDDDEPPRNPWADPTILLTALGFLFVGTVMVSHLNFMLPKMLFEDPAFGMTKATYPDPKEQAGIISQRLGLLSLPFGIMNLFSSLFLFTKATEKFGEPQPIVLSGVIGGIAFNLFRHANDYNHLLALMAVIGGCFGMILPAVGPMVARYATGVYAKNKATVQAVPMLGFAVGNTFGLNYVATLRSAYGVQAAWVNNALLFLLCTCLLAICSKRIDAALEEAQRETASTFRELLGKTPKAFAKAVAEKVEDLLLQNVHNLKYQPVQALVLKRALSVMPILPNWNEDTQGEEFLRTLWTQLEDLGPEREQYASFFPSTREAVSAITAMDVEPMQYGPIARRSTVVELQRRLAHEPSV